MSRTLDYLITGVREELLVFGVNAPVRGGYLGDPENSSRPNSISITRQLNKAQEDLALITYYPVDEFNIALTTATNRDYVAPSSWIDVLSVRYNNIRLRPTTQNELDDQFPDWELIEPSTVLSRYVLLGSKYIRLIERPDAATITANGYLDVTAVITPADLSATTSMPEYLPDVFHNALVIGAALNIANMDAGNPKAAARIPYLNAKWEGYITALKEYMKNRLSIDRDAPRTWEIKQQ